MEQIQSPSGNAALVAGGREATSRGMAAESLFKRPLGDRAVALLFGVTALIVQAAWLATLGYEAVRIAHLLP